VTCRMPASDGLVKLETHNADAALPMGVDTIPAARLSMRTCVLLCCAKKRTSSSAGHTTIASMTPSFADVVAAPSTSPNSDVWPATVAIDVSGRTMRMR